MRYFYSTQIEPGHLVLDGQEFHHLAHTLRMKIGHRIEVTDGRGNLYHGEIEAIQRGKASIEIIGQEKMPASPHELHLAISPTKNLNRMEWLVEKVTEMGVSKISFIKCKRTDRKTVREERLRRIAISALKQSKLHFLPAISSLTHYDSFIESCTVSSVNLIAHCQPQTSPIQEVVKPCTGEVIVLIGPEGDFTPEEVSIARQKGFVEISLGKARLRTETAALFVTSIIKYIHE